MTREQFQLLPYLLTSAQAEACGYERRTLNKYAENGILTVVLPAGCVQRRFQKRQFAQLLGWEDTLDLAGWQREKPLIQVAAVAQWTGYDVHTLLAIVRAGGLVAVDPGGLGRRHYRKEEVGRWIGL